MSRSRSLSVALLRPPSTWGRRPRPGKELHLFPSLWNSVARGLWNSGPDREILSSRDPDPNRRCDGGIEEPAGNASFDFSSEDSSVVRVGFIRWSQHGRHFMDRFRHPTSSLGFRNGACWSPSEAFGLHSLDSRGYSKGAKGKDKKKKVVDDYDDEDISGKGRKEKGNRKNASNDEDVDPSVIIAETRSSMNNFLDYFAKELSKLRTGRATPGMLDHVIVDYYGENKNLNFLATVTVKDSQTLSVILHDPNTASAVEKGLRNSPMQLNPILEKNNFTIPIPP